MAEIATSIIANAAGNVAAEYASPYVSYFFHFGKIIEDFRYQRNQLEMRKDRLKNDVDEARRQTEVIEKDVQDWLTTAEKELEEAQNLEDEVERRKCFRWCPNWGWRYCLSKKVAKKTVSIFQHLQISNFSRVGYCAPRQEIEFLMLNDHFMFFDSLKPAFYEIMKALSSEGVDMIGLHGMPGVGKTTLAKEVGKEARDKKLFDKVVFVTVSHTPDIIKIQDEIAVFLDLNYKTTSEKGRAKMLWCRLKNEKKVLIIFDDIWKYNSDNDDNWDPLKMKNIGIPFGDEHRGFKILLTTRLQQVCNDMNCQEKIQLNILSEEEAWVLFKVNASLENASPTLSNIAKDVATECKGLPLAIKTMGRALKHKSLDEWKVASQLLKDSRHLENQDDCGVIYKSLKISYDYLKRKNCQPCLLLCSLFPEDYEISIEELTVYGIGQGMFDDVDSIEDARREMHVITTKLQESGLLLETGGVRTVKMHDVVRDFVHWMMEGENMFLVRRGVKKWPKSESLGFCKAISLIKSEINNFPDGLKFPKLEVLLLDEKHVSIQMPRKRVPIIFFEGMKALKVLFLRNILLSLEVLQFLPNLRTLRLESCELENASSFGYLKNLEILIIVDFRIKELSYELTGLNSLRYLVVPCSFIEKDLIPKYFLSSLVQLEELYLGLNIKWAISEENANKAGQSEQSLEGRSECIPKQFVFPPLRRYDIAVNDTLSGRRHHWYESSRRLTIKKFSLNAFKELFCNVEELVLKHIMDLEYLIDTAKDQGSKSAFSNLLRLTLDNMICLKGLCHGVPPVGFLQNLETLTISYCSNLALDAAIVQNLKELTVEQCDELQLIFQMDGVALHAHQEIQMPLELSLTILHLVSLPELRSLWKGPTHHVSLRSLKVVKISSCNKLTSVFSLSLAEKLLHLEHLEISNCSGLEQVFGNMADETDNGQDIQLPRLQFLALKDLENLSSLCPRNYFVMSPPLKKFKIRCCPKLTHFPIHPLQAQSKDFLYASKDMICCSKNLTLNRTSGCRNLIPDLDREGLNGLTFIQLHNLSNLECLYDSTDHMQPTIAFSNLVELVIEEMIGLQKLYNNRPPKGFLQKLEKLKIKNCMNLASLSPVGQNLKEVTIKSCGQLREIFQVDEVLHNKEVKQASLMSNLTRLELKLLSDLSCIWKGPSHSVFNLRSLKIVKISNCNRLRCLFSPSLVKSLVQLEELILHDLPELEELITELESDVEREQQVFNMVKEKVDEQHKPFVPLMLPSLKNFGVFRCPRLTPFVIQQEVNNQAQVKGLYLSNRQCDSFDILLRQSSPNLEHGTVFRNHFRYLQWLIISNCSKLKYLFSPMLAQSLPHLSYLYVMQCKELEQIVDKDKTSASSSQGHLQPICFPSLIGLYIEECNNLKCLCPVSVNLSLSQLQCFAIRGASKLEQVFEYQGGIGIDDTEKEIVHSQLRGLSLEELPRLKSFIPMGYHCSFPYLYSLKVEECPNLTTCFSFDSNLTTHARTKATNLMEVSDDEFAWPVGSNINWIRSPWR